MHSLQSVIIDIHVFFLFYFLDESERNGKNPWVQDCYSTPERKDSVPSAVKTAGKYARVWSKAFKCSKKVKKKTLSFLEENKIKGKSANMIQFKSRDKARIKHDKARLRWSHAPFVRLDRPQRDRLRLLAFFFDSYTTEFDFGEGSTQRDA